MKDITGTIFDIKEFTIHDGPGIRTTVFLKGCPLRCIWCHNPEGLSNSPQLMISKNGCRNCGKCLIPCTHDECAPFDRCTVCCPSGLIKISGEIVSAVEISARILKQKDFFDASGGGVTFSGGEPLMQPEFLFRLLKNLSTIHRIVETSGYAKKDVFEKLITLCDEVYLDIKHPDPLIHQKVTGVSNKLIINNLQLLKISGRPYVIRIPLIPGINDSPDILWQTAGIIAKDKGNLRHVELMPYNTFAGAKYEMTGIPFRFKESAINNLESIPLDEFRKYGIKAKVL